MTQHEGREGVLTVQALERQSQRVLSGPDGVHWD